MQGSSLHQRRRSAEPDVAGWFTCYTPKQTSVYSDAINLMGEMDGNKIPAFIECINANNITEEEPSMKALCEAKFTRDKFKNFSEYFFANIGAESIATDPIDLESFKAATIQATSLDDAKKAAASDVFDSCMAANHSVPFEFFRFRSEHIPDVLRKLTDKFRRSINMGRFPPTSSILAINCMYTALHENGCAPTSAETVDLYVGIVPTPGNYDLETYQCMHDDLQFFEDICFGVAWQMMGAHEFECKEGSTGNDGCRPLRSKMLGEVHADCILKFTKASGDNLQPYKEYIIGRSNLTEENKAAARVSFDECLARNFTPPYQTYAFELEKVQGLPLLQEVLSLTNRAFSIGNLTPSMELRILDCGFTALALNGCDATTPKEALENSLVGLDFVINILGQ